ncbi:MAG: hypothetical protein HOA17_08080 [Candidatus Melainabacteria bacterium]|nr:hypothetical protein [Candidatus Melainabacteria bacterium]
MSFFQNIYSVIFRPGLAFGQLANNYSSGLLLEAIIILSIIASIQNQPNIAGILGYLSSWLITSSLIFLMAYIFKLKANDYPRFITLLGFANIPMIFLAPATIISQFNSALGLILKLIILIWAFNLNIIAVTELCQISKLKATLIYLLPALLITLIAMKFILGSIAQLMLFF